MAFRNRLLATAAIPLFAFVGVAPVSAAGLPHLPAPAQVKSDVISVETDEENELRRQRIREQRRAKEQQDNGSERKQRQSQDDDGQQQRRKERQSQQDDGQQQRRKERQDNAERKKQQRDDQQQDDAQQRRKDRQDNAERKKQQREDQQQDDAQQRRKDRQDNAERKKQQREDQQQDDAQQRRKDRQDAADKRQKQADDKRKKAEDAAERRKNRQDDNQDVDMGGRQPAQDMENQAIEKRKAEREEKRERRKADTPDRAKRKKEIARDPTKTTDTVELPIDRGNAVLDSDKDADRGGEKVRERRKREREEIREVRRPKSDRDAQANLRDRDRVKFRPVLEERGERITGFQGYDDDFGGRRVGNRDRGRFVVSIDGRLTIRSDDDTRLSRRSETYRERLSNGRIREVVVRPDGSQTITVRNRWGEIIRRSRIQPDGDEVVILYSPELEEGRDRLFLRDPGDELPPMRLSVPIDDYIIDVSREPERDYVDFLDEPPVEPIERVYSVEEVKNSARIRDKMRRIDLDTITFDTGSADISDSQANTLDRVGAAIEKIIKKDPGETFLIEGHTDAVGDDESNLVLSDSRAESVANMLSDTYGIPPENLVTQGYGERYLKVDTDGAERLNRRVTIRRITPLVRPLASND